MAAAVSFVALGVMMFVSYLTHGNIFEAIQDKIREMPLLNTCTEDVPCAANAYPPPESWKIPKFAINLDLPPSERWNQLTRTYTKELRDLITLIKNLTEPVFDDRLIKLIDKYLPPLVETLPYPFADEMKGIANSSGIPLL